MVQPVDEDEPISGLALFLVGFVLLIIIGGVGIIVARIMSDPTPEIMAPDCAPGDGRCGSGKTCEEGFCRPGEVLIPKIPVACTVGKPCADCDCRVPNICQGGKCLAEVDACGTTEVRELVQLLRKKCDARGEKMLSSCTSEDFADYKIPPRELQHLLTLFPDIVSVHFPSGRPHPKQAFQDMGTLSNHYRDALTPVVGRLANAKLVFLIGRASPRGNADFNKALAFKRLDFVHTALIDARHGDRLLIDDLRGKLRPFALGEEAEIDRTFFSRFIGETRVTWADDASKRLDRILDAREASSADIEWANDTINQVVLIIPIPCEA